MGEMLRKDKRRGDRLGRDPSGYVSAVTSVGKEVKGRTLSKTQTVSKPHRKLWWEDFP